MTYDDLTPDQQRQVDQARDETVREAAEKFQPQLVRTAFEVYLNGRVTPEQLDDYLADLDPATFVRPSGQVDLGRVRDRADQLSARLAATEPSGSQQTSGLAAGRERYRSKTAASDWIVRSTGRDTPEGAARDLASETNTAAGRQMYQGRRARHESGG